MTYTTATEVMIMKEASDDRMKRLVNTKIDEMKKHMEMALLSNGHGGGGGSMGGSGAGGSSPFGPTGYTGYIDPYKDLEEEEETTTKKQKLKNLLKHTK